MKEINKISNVLSFDFNGNKPIILYGSKELYLGDNLISNDTYASGWYINENLFFYGENSDLKCRILDINSQEIYIVGFISLRGQTLKESILIGGYSEILFDPKKIVKFNFEKREIVKVLFEKSAQNAIQYANSSYLVLKESDFEYSSFIFYNHQTETTLWQYSVAELGADKVSRILGVFGQVLVVVCEMPKSTKSILVGLDITDGSKLFTVQLPLYQMNNNLFFYEANNSIVSIIGEYLWEYSLSTFQVIREKYLPEVFNTEDVHIQVYLATLQGDSIYFAASEFGKSMSSAIVGIFDLKNEQLIDYIDLKPNGKFCMGGNSCPQVSGNKIYVLDTKKTLHILEREDG
jgi:hypothetical protein